MEDAKRFADFDLRGGAVEQLRLKRNCERLYAEIADETVKDEEFEDFCAQLSDLAFYERVKPEFPTLRNEPDEHLGDSSTYVVRMKEAAKQQIPGPYLPPGAHNEAIQLTWHFLSTLFHFVQKEELDSSTKTGLHLAFAKLFELAGGFTKSYVHDSNLFEIERLTFTGSAVPGSVKEYIEGNKGFLDLLSRLNTRRSNEDFHCGTAV